MVNDARLKTAINMRNKGVFAFHTEPRERDICARFMDAKSMLYKAASV